MTTEQTPQTNKQQFHNRAEVLDEAKRLTTDDRAKSHGDAKQNMQHFAGLLTAFFKPILKRDIEPDEASLVMVLGKMSRVMMGDKSVCDHYVDGTAYFAIAAECRKLLIESERNKTQQGDNNV